MKVLVTGATGFVGEHVVKKLLDGSFKPILAVRDEAKARRMFPKDVETVKVDLTSRDSIRATFRAFEPEAVIHLVGILFEDRKRDITFEKVHYFISLNLYEVAKEFSVRKVVHMSALGTDDVAPSRYHQTKRWAEKALMDSGLNYTIFRPSLILGPRQRLFRDLYGITKFVRVMALPDGGSYRFQPVDVRDVAECFVRALSFDETGIYNLCGDREVSFRELLSRIFEYWNRKVIMIPVPRKLMYYAGKVVERILSPPPFSSDQMLMMWKDNVCGARSDVERVLGRAPVSFEDSLKWALEEFTFQLTERN